MTIDDTYQTHENRLFKNYTKTFKAKSHHKVDRFCLQNFYTKIILTLYQWWPLQKMQILLITAAITSV
jgi:hypothetical protein